MDKLTTRKQYDDAKKRAEYLIVEGTRLGMLEPDMDNEYTREIAHWGRLMADFEDRRLRILPLEEKSPLLQSIEEYFSSHGLKEEEGARLLGVNALHLSQVMSGKRRVTMPFAKKLHSKLGIDANLILDFA